MCVSLSLTVLHISLLQAAAFAALCRRQFYFFDRLRKTFHKNFKLLKIVFIFSYLSVLLC